MDIVESIDIRHVEQKWVNWLIQWSLMCKQTSRRSVIGTCYKAWSKDIVYNSKIYSDKVCMHIQLAKNKCFVYNKYKLLSMI